MKKIKNSFKETNEQERFTSCDNFWKSLGGYLKNAFSYYYDDHWNILDTLGLIFFLIAFILKYSSRRFDDADGDPLLITIK